MNNRKEKTHTINKRWTAETIDSYNEIKNDLIKSSGYNYTDDDIMQYLFIIRIKYLESIKREAHNIIQEKRQRGINI